MEVKRSMGRVAKSGWDCSGDGEVRGGKVGRIVIGGRDGIVEGGRMGRCRDGLRVEKSVVR